MVDAASIGYRLLIANFSPMIQYEFGLDVFPIHAGLLTIIRKRLLGKKFTRSMHFKHYFWLTGDWGVTKIPY